MHYVKLRHDAGVLQYADVIDLPRALTQGTVFPQLAPPPPNIPYAYAAAIARRAVPRATPRGPHRVCSTPPTAGTLPRERAAAHDSLQLLQ